LQGSKPANLEISLIRINMGPLVFKTIVKVTNNLNEKLVLSHLFEHCQLRQGRVCYPISRILPEMDCPARAHVDVGARFTFGRF
jgi:hypothetical protein